MCGLTLVVPTALLSAAAQHIIVRTRESHKKTPKTAQAPDKPARAAKYPGRTGQLWGPHRDRCGREGIPIANADAGRGSGAVPTAMRSTEHVMDGPGMGSFCPAVGTLGPDPPPHPSGVGRPVGRAGFRASSCCRLASPLVIIIILASGHQGQCSAPSLWSLNQHVPSEHHDGHGEHDDHMVMVSLTHAMKMPNTTKANPSG